MNEMILQSDTMLAAASKLNSNLGRHDKKCSFSTHLTGRFYQNNSLESHKARAHRIAQMKVKRKQLEKSLDLEEKKILFLESLLKEREKQRIEEERMRLRVENAAICIQSQIRRILSVKKLEVLQVESEIINYVVQFIQSLYRGRRDRRRVDTIKSKIIQHRKEESSAITIQSRIRTLLAKMELDHRIDEYFIRCNQAACLIQAQIRGHKCRQDFQDLKIERSAVKIQSCYRGIIARRIKDMLKKAKNKKKKDKRIPLHERRYSTYSIEPPSKDSIGGRRVTDFVNIRNQVTSSSTSSTSGERGGRLSGLELLRLAHHSQVLEHRQQNNGVNDDSTATSNKNKDPDHDSMHTLNEYNSSEEVASHDKDDKILVSRKKAALRAAKMKKKIRDEKLREQQQANDKKKGLDQLEQNRRKLMKVHQHARELKKDSKTNITTIGNGPLHEHETLTSKDSKILCHNNKEIIQQDDSSTSEHKHNTQSKNLIIDNSFDEAFQENEFDLDDMI